MRVTPVLVVLVLAVACSKPSEQQCRAMEDNVRMLAGMVSAMCARDFTKDEVRCLASKGWLKIAECPGFSKLGIEKSRFDAVHCFSEVDSDGTTQTNCAFPWVTCNDRRERHLSPGTGKTISECDRQRDPWAVEFACPDRSGQTCIEYFSNNPECEAALPRLRASANNVRECHPFSP